MRRSAWSKVAFAVAVATTITASGCGYGPGSAESYTASSGGAVDFDPDASLSVATVAVPTGFDPHRERTAGERPYYFPIFDRLTRLSDTLTPEPMLAKSWETAPDALSMTMVLRDDVRFHDGEVFDAETVRLNIERAKNLADSTVKAFLATVESVEELDPQTVIFRFNAPSPDMATTLAGPPGAMISKRGVTDPTVDLRADPGNFGSGPYLVDTFVSSQSVTYTRAPERNWDPEAGKLAHLEIRFIADDRTRDSAIRAGEIDVAYVNGVVSQAVAQAELAAQGSTLKLVSRETDVLAALWLRADRFPDPRIRQALVTGIDRDAIAEGYYQGTCAPSSQLTREGFSGHVPDFEDPYPYDPERSTQLLADAGYPDGIDFDLSYAAGREALPVIASNDLAGTGVRTQLRPGTSIEALTAFRTSQTDSFMYSVAPMATVPDTVRWLQSKAGLEYQDSDLAAKVEQASRAVTVIDRERATADLVEAVAKAAIFVPICHYTTYYLVASDVVGLDEATSADSQFILDLRAVGRTK
jgi:peptide/nickel transport system substrate-binding protein